MAAEDKKISVLTEWLYGSIANAANIIVAHAGANYRIAMSTLKQYVLGDREINGTRSGDIPTNGGSQMFTNKRLDAPSFNSDTTLNSNVTATQMNLLQNLDVNVKQKFDSLDSDVSGIENNIYDLLDAVNALQADKIYSIGQGASSTSITIDASIIDSLNRIDPNSLSIFVYEQRSATLLQLVNLSNIFIAISGNYLSSVTIGDVVQGKSYQIVIRYRVIAQ
jgi:hypothetical protein